jgi:hypothetical protein
VGLRLPTLRFSTKDLTKNLGPFRVSKLADMKKVGLSLDAMYTRFGRNTSHRVPLGALSIFHSAVERAVEKQEKAIFVFDKQKGFNDLQFGAAFSLELGNCTDKRH